MNSYAFYRLCLLWDNVDQRNKIWHPYVYREQIEDRRSDIPVLIAKQIEDFSMASRVYREQVEDSRFGILVFIGNRSKIADLTFRCLY